MLKILLILCFIFTLISCSSSDPEKLVGVWGYEENGVRTTEIAIYETHAVIYEKNGLEFPSIPGVWKNNKVFEPNGLAIGKIGTFEIVEDGRLYAPVLHQSGYLTKFDGQIKTLPEN